MYKGIGALSERQSAGRRILRSFEAARLSALRWGALCAVGVMLSGCLSTLTESAAPEKNVNVLPNAARTAEQQGRYGEAANFYRKMYLDGDGELGTLLGYARNLRYAGAASDAVSVLEGAEDSYPETSGFLLELGKARLAAGRGNAAVLALLRAVKVDPENWEVHSALGIGYDLVREAGPAADSYRRALALSPGNPVVLNNSAISLAQRGEIDAAIKVLESVPNLARSKPQIRQNLALFHGIKGNFKQAERYAKLDLSDDMVKSNMAYFRRFQEKPVTIK